MSVAKMKRGAGTSIPHELDKQRLLDFYRQMFLLRRFERTAQALLKAGVVQILIDPGGFSLIWISVLAG